MNDPRPPTSYWSQDVEQLLATLAAAPGGLTSEEAGKRLEEFGENLPGHHARTGTISLLASQFGNPIVVLLFATAVISYFLSDHASAIIIVVIVVLSALLGFWQERGASQAVERLLEMVRVTVTVLRDGGPTELPLAGVVPGDVVLLNAGAVVPADGRIIEARDLFVNEAALTGESFPVEKLPSVLPEVTGLAHRTNTALQGTHVVSGQARLLVVHTGGATEFGTVTRRLREQPARTEFEAGIRQFGGFLMVVTLGLVALIFVVNALLGRVLIESLLFSLALAVGLTPNLLPAIISVNLASGARRMARRQVIVKRPASIPNFGSMTVLCSDKTGTLTEGTLQLRSAIGVTGEESEQVLLHAHLNSAFQTGFTNPFDQAILRHREFDVSGYRKLDEVPYDFTRKRLSVLVGHGAESTLVTKGAIAQLLAICSTALMPDGTHVPLDTVRGEIEERAAALGDDGLRLLAVASRSMGGQQQAITRDDETDLTFLGLIVVADPPKSDVAGAIAELTQLGVGVKIISGDTAPVVRYVAEQVGLPHPVVLTGREIRALDDEHLPIRARATQVFAEIEPELKERIVIALQRAGEVVGFLGDGINDAPALNVADVGISVQQAVDVAREAADIVLLEKDLDVLAHGVEEGRRTFANTMKYILMATSANFGNMFSMAGASLFLPFLPLLPSQILLTNFLTDLPEMTISTDRVDPELVSRPRRWNIASIRRFMYTFGLLSSVFDFLTFGFLLLVLHATPELFRTGWFVLSVVSATVIVLVIRTRRPVTHSRPSAPLAIATVFSVVVAVALPYTPLAAPLQLVPLPGVFLAAMAGIVALYVVGAELAKRWFYGRRRPGRVS